MRVPFPKGLEGISNLPRTKRSLLNCYNNGQGNVVSRQGISLLSNPGGVARGGFTWNGELYNVYSQQLIKVTDTGTGATEVIGIISGSDVIRTATGFNDAVIVVKGGSIYTLSNSTVQISIISVIDVSSLAEFIHFGTGPDVGNTVTLSGFSSSSYNVTGIVTALANNPATLTAITSVTDNSGIAVFNYSGSSPAIGETVTISDFITNTLYNTIGIVTSATGMSFEISSISFGSDETGSFVIASTFQIDEISFISDDTGSFALVLSDISSNPEFVPCNDVTHINGRFVYIPSSGDPAFFSDVGVAGSVQPLSFFDAEELPDKNNAVFNGKNTLYICGTDSIELFRDVGSTPNVFVRVTGGRILNGFIGGLLEYNNTFLFIGREKDQDRGIYAIAAGSAPKISNEAIDTILSDYTIEELSNAITGRIKHHGNDIATFTLARDSFAFFGGNWFILETIEDDISRPWSAGFITQFKGDYYTAFSDRLGKFGDVNNDYGSKITKRMNIGLEQEDGNNFSFQSLELGISQGFNDSVGSVGLRTSDDNVIYNDFSFEKTGDIGEYGQKLIWSYPGGLGTYPGFFGAEIYTTDDINFSADHLILNNK